jgi:phosphatidate cytidylyltransferase
MFVIAPAVLSFVTLIGGLLLAAGGVIVCLRPLHISGYDNIVLRYKAWWLMALVFGGAVLAHRGLAFVLMTGLGLWAMYEYYGLVPELRTDRRLTAVCYGSVLALMMTALGNWYGLFQAMPIYCILSALLMPVTEGRTDGVTRRAGYAILGIVYFGWMLAHLLLLLNYSAGMAMLFYLVLLTALNDVGAYISGRLFGRHKLAPSISPQKTVEGLAGALVGTLLLGGVLRSWVALPLAHALLLSAICSLGGAVGDLVISSFKRDRQVKDTGNAIAGHGGLLDRLNSLLFVTPLFFHYARYFDLLGVGQ